MGVGALMVVDKSVAGEVWSNTYGLALGAPPYNLEPDPAAFIAWGAAGDLSAAGTADVAGGYATIIQSILNFERRIHDDEVHFERLYITDGKKNFVGSPPVEVPNAFFTATLNFNATHDAGVTGSIATGLVSLLAAKNPSGFSKRRGRCFYRVCLSASVIRTEATGLIDWHDDASRAAVVAQFTASVTGSGLDTHFAGAANVAGGLFVIPHFSRYVPAVGTNPATGGEWLDGTPIASFVALKPVGRQVRRGRKRPALG